MPVDTSRAGALLFGPITNVLEDYFSEQRARAEREDTRRESRRRYDADVAWRQDQARQSQENWEANQSFQKDIREENKAWREFQNEQTLAAQKYAEQASIARMKAGPEQLAAASALAQHRSDQGLPGLEYAPEGRVAMGPPVDPDAIREVEKAERDRLLTETGQIPLVEDPYQRGRPEDAWGQQPEYTTPRLPQMPAYEEEAKKELHDTDRDAFFDDIAKYAPKTAAKRQDYLWERLRLTDDEKRRLREEANEEEQNQFRKQLRLRRSGRTSRGVAPLRESAINRLIKNDDRKGYIRNSLMGKIPENVGLSFEDTKDAWEQNRGGYVNRRQTLIARWRADKSIAAYNAAIKRLEQSKRTPDVKWNPKKLAAIDIKIEDIAKKSGNRAEALESRWVAGGTVHVEPIDTGESTETTGEVEPQAKPQAQPQAEPKTMDLSVNDPRGRALLEKIRDSKTPKATVRSYMKRAKDKFNADRVTIDGKHLSALLIIESNKEIYDIIGDLLGSRRATQRLSKRNPTWGPLAGSGAAVVSAAKEVGRAVGDVSDAAAKAVMGPGTPATDNLRSLLAQESKAPLGFDEPVVVPSRITEKWIRTLPAYLRKAAREAKREQEAKR